MEDLSKKQVDMFVRAIMPDLYKAQERWDEDIISMRIGVFSTNTKKRLSRVVYFFFGISNHIIVANPVL